jgi:hypothetical protein
VSSLIFCCGGILLVIALIYLPIFLVRKGFDLVVGCLSNGFVLAVAAILLVVYIVIADVDVCQIWLVGDPLCSFWTSIAV